jgi:GDP-L-fucose synthase
MKVLVTGGSGLVGSSIKELVNLQGTLPFIDVFGFIFLNSKDCDFRNEQQVDDLFNLNKPEIVIHLAAKVAGLYGNISNNYTMLVDNIKINTNVLEACRKYKIKRLINILSSCVFPASCRLPLTSDQIDLGPPHNSNEGYSFSKRILSTGSKLLSKSLETEVVNLIPTNLAGKYDNFNLSDGHVLPVLIAKTYLAQKNNKPLIIKGLGESYRQFVFSTDFAKIILHFVNCILPQQFNQLIVGPPVEDEITIKELVNKIVKEFDFNGPVVYDSSFPEGQFKKTVSSDELLSYIPNFKFTPLDVYLKETIKYFIENYETVRK